MKHAWPLLVFVCAALVCLAAIMDPSGLAYAITTVSGTKTIHNGDSQHRAATDLHFKFRFQEYECPYYCWFENWTITTAPSLDGTTTITPIRGYNVANAESVVCEIWVNYTQIKHGTDNDDVLYCQYVRIDGSFDLNAWNEVIIDSVYWTYDTGDPVAVEALPSQGFAWLPLKSPIQVMPGQPHTTTCRLENVDATVPFTVSNLRFYWDDVWHPAKTWTDSVGTCILTVPGPVTLNPGSYYDIELSVPWSPPGPRPDPSYIYVYGEEEYQMPGFNVVEHLPFQYGHQETLVYGTPAIGTWGLLVLAALVVATAVWLIRRRRLVRQA